MANRKQELLKRVPGRCDHQQTGLLSEMASDGPCPITGCWGVLQLPHIDIIMFDKNHEKNQYPTKSNSCTITGKKLMIE